jgi:hopene-associated glycosyltransferase HpnB
LLSRKQRSEEKGQRHETHVSYDNEREHSVVLTVLNLLGLATVGIWSYLLLARGGFWRIGDSPAAEKLPLRPPSVAAVVPARNEADVVAAAVSSLASQQYAGPFHIFLVDDGSDDGTVAAARSAASADTLTIVTGAPLPSGWTGKLWAVSQGIRQAAPFTPDYLLLTDADIVHPPTGLADLVSRAKSGGYDLVSWMVTLRCRSFAERALIPAFVFFFFMLYPPSWIADSRRKTAGAAGGCMLIRRQALERIGGIECIRGELIDDCALAQAVKQTGGRVWLGLNSGAHSIRDYETFASIERMIARSAFTQLRYSVWLLVATIIGMVLTYVAPVVLALSGDLFGIAAWAMICVAYIPVLRFYRRRIFWAPLLPVVAVFYMVATVHSAARYWKGSGGMWKGRAQAAS